MPVTAKYVTSSTHSDYYACSAPEGHKPVTVVHTRYDTVLCMTCTQNNRMDCEHTRAVRTLIDEGGGPDRAPKPVLDHGDAPL